MTTTTSTPTDNTPTGSPFGHPVQWIITTHCTRHPRCGSHAWLAADADTAAHAAAPTLRRHLTLNGEPIPADTPPVDLLRRIDADPQGGLTVLVDTTRLFPTTLRDQPHTRLVAQVQGVTIIEPGDVRDTMDASSDYYGTLARDAVDALTDPQIGALLDQCIPFTINTGPVSDTIDMILDGAGITDPTSEPNDDWDTSDDDEPPATTTPDPLTV